MPEKLETAPNKFIEAAGIRFAYRHFGKPTGIPLVFLQHFSGNMDSWDPAVVNALASSGYTFEDKGATKYIIFDNLGPLRISLDLGASTITLRA
jgi:pimeloyl-ACP methyl ester carboxylesterase